DYNQSLDYDEALARLRRLDAEDLEWIEEPLPAEDVAGYARLCAAIATPIQAGESWWSPEEAERNLAAGACDLALPDVARDGAVPALRGGAAAVGWMETTRIPCGASSIAHDFVSPVSPHLLAA